MNVFLGVDVGSVSTNLALITEDNQVLWTSYLRTKGQPITTIKRGIELLQQNISQLMTISGVGTTGSARRLAAVMLGADSIKNEITAHAVAACNLESKVQTVIEIGGQDSKIIIIRDGVVVDFAMNTVCAAGTGSFLDQQASRLGLPIEEFGDLALQSKTPVRIAGRCSVFAESDMIHKQQMGHNLPDILAGLCEAMVRNYLNNVGKGKEIRGPIVFQGGVAANIGIVKAFDRAFGQQVLVPEHFNVMGAVGSAILAKEAYWETGATNFRGLDIAGDEFNASSFECSGCANMCEVIGIKLNNRVIARWGDRCGKWEQSVQGNQEQVPKVAS